MASRSLLWLRRDLRVEDHPALSAAAATSRVVALFVVDPALWHPAGPPRRAALAESLAALDADLDGRLTVRWGDPADVVPTVAAEVAAQAVHVTADAGPYGRRRDSAVELALARMGVRWRATGTPYAVGPGILRTGAGTPFRVFTPFLRAWVRRGWPQPAPSASARQALVSGPGDDDQARDVLSAARAVQPGSPAGEAAARARWRTFRDGGLDAYAQMRDRPDLTGTSGLSTALKFGELHPRTLLADLAGRTGPGAESFRTELAWREFHADVLWHHPASAREYLRPEHARMRYDPPGPVVQAWRAGRTGYPFVDAGMRQLLTEGWMHNRVRMVTASFLVKDLHVEWTVGARWFMQRLRDGDLASNQHGWQWVAGCGTDAAPYFRVFNPVAQGLRFDPDGAYVRRYVPELAHLAGATAHRPWAAPDGYAHGYPARVVDHDVERQEALTRYGIAVAAGRQ